MDLKSYSRWYDYSRARDAMFAATDTTWAPWYIADADDKKRARLNIISHLLSQVPYKPLAPPPRYQAAQTAAARRLRAAGPVSAAHPDTVLTVRLAASCRRPEPVRMVEADMRRRISRFRRRAAGA